jgi:RNA polymerase sigma-70 factor (ECF subfamily)
MGFRVVVYASEKPQVDNLHGSFLLFRFPLPLRRVYAMPTLLERAEGERPLDPETILNELQPRIEKMAAYFGRQCSVDEDDLRQEAWLAVLEMLPRLDVSIGSPEQHLLKRARWRILDTIRWQRRRRHLPLCEVEAHPAPMLEMRPDMDMTELQTRLTTIQRRILRGLMEGYTWREVGAVVGCTSANVAYHVRRIREVYLQLQEGA